MSAFPDVAGFADASCRDAGLDAADALRLRLILEELFTNTVHHGHGGDSDRAIEIALEIAAAGIALTYEDEAPAFDPRTPVEPDDAREASDAGDSRPVGRLGLVLVRRLACQITYERAEGRNRIRLWLPSTRPV
jgi:anti-sigma regulatory factor (Ser/Thr protein kinase)